MCGLPAEDVLEELLSTTYQATLLREEERPVTFRLILSSPEAFPEVAGPPDGLQRMVFTHRRPFTEHELRRLSPAAKFYRSLVGVEIGADRTPYIWGILQSGPRWLEGVRGGRRSLDTLPDDKLVIRASGPGRVAVSSGLRSLGEIRGGEIAEPKSDVFESKWLPAMFASERNELKTLHENDRGGREWAELDADVSRLFSQQMVKRLVATISSAHHGGTIVILPPHRTTTQGRGFLRLKYSFEDGEPRRRYRTLATAAMAELASSCASSEGPIGWSAYRASASQAIATIDEAVIEVAQLIAALADVDGAVVLTKRFEIIGFGAEIAGDFPDVPTVMRALDLEGTEREEEGVEGVGTRHRSAYRLVSAERDALVVVVSQDGTVRFVTYRDGAVTYWDHVSTGSL